MLHAFLYIGILRYILEDNKKSVVIRRDGQGHPIWQKDSALLCALERIFDNATVFMNISLDSKWLISPDANATTKSKTLSPINF